jgi:Cu-processing system permease protein
MTAAMKVFRYGLSNQFRSRWVLGYGLVFLLLTDALFRFGGSGPRAVASMTNVVLLVIPLVSIMLGTLHVANSREFVELLLAQPVSRRSLFTGLYLGLAVPLALAFVLGVGTPLLLHGRGAGAGQLAVLLGTGTLLTFVFTALAFLAGLAFDDKAKGLGFALLLWFVSAVLYDGLVLLGATIFSDYPLEAPMLLLTLLNPVDLARTLLLLAFDVTALMGYTGAVFERFFGSALGMSTAAGALLLWVAIPALLGMRRFARKDF